MKVQNQTQLKLLDVHLLHFLFWAFEILLQWMNSNLEAILIYQRIGKPDRIAFNSYLDTCCRCGKLNMMLDTMKEYTTMAKNIKKKTNRPIKD